MKMQTIKIEIIVGLFMILGLACLAYLAVNLGEVKLLGDNTYPLKARFTSVSGLKEGSYVEAAGVRIGKVSDISFETGDYLAVVIMEIDDNVVVAEDATASIRTSGIIGDKFIKISPGGSPEQLQPGGEILETEPSISLEELISKYIFESGD